MVNLSEKQVVYLFPTKHFKSIPCYGFKMKWRSLCLPTNRIMYHIGLVYSRPIVVCASVHGATVLPNPITVLPDLFTEEHFGWPQRAYHMHLHAATTAVTTSTLGTKCAMWIEWSSTCLSLNSLSVGKLQPPANEMFLKHVSDCLSNCLSIYRMFLCCLHPQRSLS